MKDAYVKPNIKYISHKPHCADLRRNMHVLGSGKLCVQYAVCSLREAVVSSVSDRGYSKGNGCLQEQGKPLHVHGFTCASSPIHCCV